MNKNDDKDIEINKGKTKTGQFIMCLNFSALFKLVAITNLVTIAFGWTRLSARLC
ncbi:MAG: hypothetical protein ACI89U_002544 [Gammaproteobacteria bacterium]|jgi:hypothetical protein